MDLLNKLLPINLKVFISDQDAPCFTLFADLTIRRLVITEANKYALQSKVKIYDIITEAVIIILGFDSKSAA